MNQAASSEKIEAVEGPVQQVATDSSEGKGFKQKQFMRQQFRRRGGPGQIKRQPLKIWKEYAHALLQANETSFVN